VIVQGHIQGSRQTTHGCNGWDMVGASANQRIDIWLPHAGGVRKVTLTKMAILQDLVNYGPQL